MYVLLWLEYRIEQPAQVRVHDSGPEKRDHWTLGRHEAT